MHAPVIQQYCTGLLNQIHANTGRATSVLRVRCLSYDDDGSLAKLILIRPTSERRQMPQREMVSTLYFHTAQRISFSVALIDRNPQVTHKSRCRSTGTLVVILRAFTAILSAGHTRRLLNRRKTTTAQFKLRTTPKSHELPGLGDTRNRTDHISRAAIHDPVGTYVLEPHDAMRISLGESCMYKLQHHLPTIEPRAYFVKEPTTVQTMLIVR